MVHDACCRTGAAGYEIEPIIIQFITNALQWSRVIPCNEPQRVLGQGGVGVAMIVKSKLLCTWNV